jgi:hypothetical protein
MTQNKLEIKILKDSGENDVSLMAMTLEAAKAFLIIVESITKIVELTPNNEQPKIQITSGSAVVTIEGEMIEEIKQEFDQILKSQSSQKELVEQWRRVQKVFAANGLHYEANFFQQGEKIPIYDALKNRQKLRSQPIKKKKLQTTLTFLSGKLIAVGGKKPNIHIETKQDDDSNEERITIACTEANAGKAKVYLYQTIRCSLWRQNSGGRKQFILCDSYHTEDIFLELQSFVKEMFEQNEIEALKCLHYRCRDYLNEQDYGRLRKLLRLFTHESTDINILKTILIITQSVKHQERLKSTIDMLQTLFDRQLGEIRKQTEKRAR